VIRAVLGGDVDYELEWIEARGGTRSRSTRRSGRALEAFVAEASRARRLPARVRGFTDSHWLREAFGTVAYGFFPRRASCRRGGGSLIHSADERVPVADLELGVALAASRGTSHAAAEPTTLRRWHEEEKIRLGGMALRTACSCTGRTRGPCAIRRATGRSRSSRRASASQASRSRTRFLRGPVALAEALRCSRR
jgi:hypothetical protein